MATTDQLVTKAKLILSRRSDTALDAAIINELGLAQERLEREAWLPKFLYTKQQITVTSDDVDLESVLTRFLGLCEEPGGIKFRVSPAATEPFAKLRKYDDREQLLQRFPGTLAAGGTVQGYFLVDRLLTLRPYPSASVPQDLEVHFYQAEVNLPAAGNSTVWTQKASDYLLGEAGQIIAQSLRDKEAEARFKFIRGEDKARIYKKDIAEGEADLDRSMGDED